MEEHGYILNDCKSMCVLHNDSKIQNGKWLSRGKHRWGVVKAHRRESRKRKEPTISAFKKKIGGIRKRTTCGNSSLYLEKRCSQRKSTLSCPM